jgi:hypothetical protein
MAAVSGSNLHRLAKPARVDDTGAAAHTAGMTDQLRSIAVKVEEPSPGAFHWTLIESAEGASTFRQLAISEAPYDNWLLALVAGVEALQRLTGDSSRGPRKEIR